MTTTATSSTTTSSTTTLHERGPLDTQRTTHGSSYAYSSPDYPEFYDAWVEAMFSSSGPVSSVLAEGGDSDLEAGINDRDKNLDKNEDIPVFVELIREQINLLASSSVPDSESSSNNSGVKCKTAAINVVDLGTGTGRVVCEIYRELLGGRGPGADELKGEDEGQENMTMAQDDDQRMRRPIRINIWGIDHSQSMLDTARETFDSQWPAWEESARSRRAGKPTWLCASASEFFSVLEGSGCSTSNTTSREREKDKAREDKDEGENKTTLQPGQITILLLSAGTIHHLAVDPLELLSFLKQLSHGLCPRTGRAVISVLDEMVPTNLHHDQHPQTTTSEPSGETKAQEREESGVAYKADLIIPSRKYPGAVYVKSPTVTTEIERPVHVQLLNESGPTTVGLKSRVRTDTWTVLFLEAEAPGSGLVQAKDPEKEQQKVVADAGAGGKAQGRLVWKKEMQWSLSVWDEDLFTALVVAVGLEVLGIRKGGFQRWYILGKRSP